MENDNLSIVDADKRISLPFLSKYERASIEGIRKEQLAKGAPPMVDITDCRSIDDIYEKEFKNRVVPLKIRRPMPNGTVEEWSLSELVY